MNPIRCLVVDDERLARQVMRDLLAAHADFEVVAEAATIAEAAERFRLHRPDVLFLDIQMPGGDGFQLLDLIAPELPFVIFVTAYERHALHAFEANALDYLLKPVEPARLALAVERLRQRLQRDGAPEPAAAALPRLREEHQVLLPLGNSGCFAPVRDILHVTAQGKHSVVSLRDGRRVVVRQTLATWMLRLPASLFAALDRSCIVQWREVRHANFTVFGARLEFDKPGGELTLGRAGARRLRRLLTASAP